MRQQIQIISRLLCMTMVCVYLVACSSQEDENGTKTNEVELAHKLNIKVNLLDYNAEEEHSATRATNTMQDTLGSKILDMGNGFIARMTISKDTANNASRTRSLSVGTYTMLAFQGGIYKGEVTGTVDWAGRFNYNPFNRLELSPGTYDFVLYNDKVTRTGNNLSVTQANLQTALIGRTTYTVSATPERQQVEFQIKHCGSRIRIKWVCFLPISNPTGNFYTNIGVPATSIYDAATGNWSMDSRDSRQLPMTYTGGSRYNGYSEQTNDYTAISDYLYFLPAAPINDMYFNCGRWTSSIHNKTFNSIFRLSNISSLSSLDPNKSYVITLKFAYNCWYLMSDGTIGLTRETTAWGGTKTPIGVVVSRSKRLAAALTANEKGMYLKWDTFNQDQQTNSIMFSHTNLTACFSDMNGYHYTWEDNGKGYDAVLRKGDNPQFPAFYYAGHYGEKLATKVHLSNGMETKKWHLPSLGEWVYFCKAFGDVTDASLKWIGTPWNLDIATAACTQVGGGDLYSYEWVWSSTEIDGGAGRIIMPAEFRFHYLFKGGNFFDNRVIPFVYY